MDFQNGTAIPERVKTDLRIEEDFYKQKNRQALRIQFERQKNLVRENERELKKSQTEVIAINEQGVVEVQTQNLRIDANPRIVTNFFFPQIAVFRRLKNPSQEIYIFYADFNQKIKYGFLDPEKCGSGTYILKKLAKIGCQIFAPTLAMKKTYATQMITLLITQMKDNFVVPDRREWYIDESGEIKFFEGKWTWEELEKCVKS